MDEEFEDQKAVGAFEEKIIKVLEETDMNSISYGICSDILINHGLALFISSLIDEAFENTETILEIKSLVMGDISDTFDSIYENIKSEMSLKKLN